jgi:hypothetical protein
METSYEIQYVKRGAVHTLQVPVSKARNYTQMNLLFTMLIDRHPHRDWWLVEINPDNHGQQILNHYQDFCTDEYQIWALA